MTIVISSTDSYQDCWNPFFSLFERFMDDMSKFKIYLITDNVTYNDHSFVKTILTSKKGKILPWSDRIKFALDHIEDESFLLLLEDYFLYSSINFTELKRLKSILNNYPNIGSIKIVNHHNSNLIDSSFKDLKIIKKFSSYRISLQPTLWKKDFLKELLIKGENPWHFEILGTFRSFFVNKKLLVLSYEWFESNKKIYDTNGAGAIKKGEWISSELNKVESILLKKVVTSRNFFSEKKDTFSKFNIIKNTLNVRILSRTFKFLISKRYL